MNKIKTIATKIAYISLIAGFYTQIGYATTNSAISRVEKDVLKERIETLYSPVDLRYTDEVHRIVHTYIGSFRKGSERLLGLSERFFPIYEAEFSKAGLPEELKYLSIVESGLRPNVVSKAGAAGLWQFMKTTANLYGLTTNSVVDERRDLYRSTQAASQYLKDLYAQFDDWTLALAAYNCGPGNVRKALRRSKKGEFWGLKSFLPKETRRYIPKYVAISYLMNYSNTHGLSPELDYDANTIVTVRIHDYTTLKKISSIAGLDFEAVKELNPAFLKNYIPKSTKGYLLTLPEINMYNLLAQTGGWENVIKQPFHSAALQQRFYRYGEMKKQMDKLVPLVNSNSMLYIGPKSTLNQASSFPTPDFELIVPPVDMRTASEGTYHKLSAQQSISDVAKLWNLSLKKLIAINEIDVSNPPIPGSLIRID